MANMEIATWFIDTGIFAKEQCCVKSLDDNIELDIMIFSWLHNSILSNVIIG